ncbi:transcriptional regulator ATRX-like isoform X1 [Temnothorax curvispinosus]|uniref:ATP-dependent helicase ATRX n=1 Tax=Temnothorax curvispinosus TaxID=300111 RepID=A0A6J1Q4A2_9HYME|nr:transcriptional regulator ATRX-like isoform X1 [Temnothorax curvispinosus]
MSWKRRIKATPQELAYREKHFHDIRIIRDKQIVCTACGNELNIETKQIFSNPIIGILLCKVCWNHLKNIDAKFDKDEAKRYCYICGESKKLYVKLYVCCNKDCFSAFCKGCIKRNVNSSLLDAAKKDWKCFTCNSKPIWDLRGICAAVMDSLPKKGNKRSNKIEKRILPSQVQRVEKTREVQKVLHSLCDREDDDSSTKSFVSARSMQKVDTKNRHTNHDTSSIRQKTTMEIDLTDSSSESSSVFSNKRDKRSKSDKDKKAKSTRDSSDRNVQKDSRSVIKERTSKRLIISSDSMDSTDSSSKTITEKRTSKRNVKSEKIVKRKTNSNRIHSSDSESDENDTKRASNVSKRISKDTIQQNKKMDNSYNAKSKDKAKRCHDSTSESEDEERKRRSRKKRSETSLTSHGSNDERKRDKSSNSRFSNIQKDDSDNSSSKEFQKKKLQKVNRNKFSRRKLVDLEIDHTKSPSVKNSVNEKSKKQIDKQADQNFNDIKKILKDCKKKCSDFQMFIESIEHLYGKEDELLILKSAEKIDNLKTVLEEKRKDLTTSYQLWSKNRKKSATKRYKEISDDEQSSEECEKRTVDEDIRISGDEQGRNKAVSECDSEEIFSANETKTGKKQKMQAAQSKASTTRTKNNNGTNIDEEENRMSVDESKNNDKDNVDIRNDLAISPVIGSLKEKKTSTERSSKKQLLSECNKNNNKIQPTDENTNTNAKASLNTDIYNDETEIEDSPSRDNCKVRTLENDEVGQSSKRNIINESTDLFDTSFEDAGENRTEVEIETNCDKEKLLHTSKDKFSDLCKDPLKDKVPDEEERASLLSYNMGEEEDLSNRIAQEKMTPSVTKEAYDDSKTNGKTNTDNESLDDAEALAKKALLATDSDTSDTLPDKNVAKLTEDLKVTNDTNQTEKKTEDDDSNSVSTVMIIKEANTDVKDTITDEGETKVEKKSDNRLDKKSRKKKSSSDEDAKIAKAERAAKRALLESNSDDSTPLSSESGKLTYKKSESDSSEKNTKAKLSLLASSSEISSPEMANVSKSTKRYHEPEPDRESAVTRLKKRRLNLDKNYYYKNDKKLRMSCKVHLNRLSAEVLKCHSRALGKSTEYLEHKALKSLINLDKLEKSRKKNAKKDSDSLTDDDLSSKIARSSNKQKEKAKAKQESLMDHLKRIENDNISPTIEMDSDTDIEESAHQISKVNDMPVSNEALMSEADRIAKENLLNTSDSSEKEGAVDSDDNINNDDRDKTVENKKKKHQKTEEKTSKQDSKKDKSDWRRDKLLTNKFSDTDSESEREKWKKKQEKIANESKENNSDSDEERLKSKKKKKKKKGARRILDSDSDVKITDVDSDSSEASSAKQNSSDSESDLRREKEKLRRKRRKRGDSNSSDTDSSLTEKKSKPKRKRIKKMASDSDSSNAEIKNSQGSTPGKSGRKNIRKVLKDKQVAEDTKLAAKEEEERLKRIAERQALYNEMYEMRLAGEEKVDKLVLDFDTETKKELVTVHEELVKRLKPHQAQGIKFMWDACFESLERVKTTSGSGCIIAHCMGLGKTLQVIALTHTLLTHEETNIKTVLIVCPLSTVLNWLNEYNTWLKDLDDIEVYELTKFKKNFERKYQLQRWQRTGGVMIIGYEMFRNLTGPNKNIRKGMKEAILECLVDPGADLVVCDEGHLLKNEDTALSKCMRSVKTLRRIVLTGTPLQNNLIEYHCMVQFVKPNLLGTKKEFLNRFVNPITNGQFDDSTAYDVKLMKKRAHVLHKMLEGSVQRFDYSVLTPFLPPKQEYVIFVRLTDTQVKMYQYYLENLARRHAGGQGGTLFADFQALQRIWTHPVVLRLNAEKIERANEKKELSESEGSLKDFINDDTTDIETSINSDSSNDSDVQAVTIDDDKNVPKPSRRTRNNPVEEEPEEEHKEENTESEWWTQFVQSEHFEDMRVSAKLLLLFGILKECEQIGDKVLVFSQSLYSLTLIEEFLRRIDDQTQNDTHYETLDNHTGSWSLGLDYFRLDGQTSPENRNIWCKIFNKPTNTRARLFLISTRAGGLGINLTAANRVIIFDASWNPSHDVQSIFRIYRFGQKKPCYVYRFLAAGTMEEKIYNRQVTKLSLSCRVVDEQQIERHYSNHNLNELYMFEGYNDEEKPTLNLPKDRLLAEIFLKFKDYVENYHEHDSLLENKAEEELNEEERKQAWLEYEEEKKGKPPMMNTMLVNPMANTAYQNNMLLQQYNMMMNSVMPQNMQVEYENLQQLIRKDYPNATPEQQKMITNRALMEMYNYWEKQATLFNKQPTQPIRNPVMPNFQQRPQTPNFQQRPQVPNNSNVHVNQQATQLNQLLSGQSMNYINTNKPVQPSGAQMADLLPNITYRNTPSANNISGNTDQDIIEMIPSTSNAGVTRQSGMSSAQVAAQPIDNSKIQEE